MMAWSEAAFQRTRGNLHGPPAGQRPDHRDVNKRYDGIKNFSQHLGGVGHRRKRRSVEGYGAICEEGNRQCERNPDRNADLHTAFAQ